MNALGLINRMQDFGESLRAVVRDVNSADARWRPADGNWSILEIVRHLGDEEVEDFRTRLRLTLADPAQDWPRIDPPGWAIARQYNEGELSEAVDRFARERAESIQWLRGLGNTANWSIAHHHPKIGPIRAGDLLAAWAAHDTLHLRQLAKRMFQLAQRDAGEFSTRYAGEWSA